MTKLLELNKFEIELLCLKLGFLNLIPFIRDLTVENTKPQLMEIIEYCLQAPDAWPQWYVLYHHPINQPPTISNTFYYPGMCFQRRFKWHWERGFEYRFARKTTIRCFLLSTQRASKGNISADLQSYILSFLLPQELGKEIPVNNYNAEITLNKNYLVKTFRMNHCRVGHTMNEFNGCPRCMNLHIYYQKLKIQEEMEAESMPDEYNLLTGDINKLSPLKLELDILRIKHKIKLERLMKRAEFRQERFRFC